MDSYSYLPVSHTCAVPITSQKTVSYRQNFLPAWREMRPSQSFELIFRAICPHPHAEIMRIARDPMRK